MPRITHEDIARFINEAIEEQQFDSCFALLKGLRPVDIADALELVDNEHAWRILDRLPKRAEIFSYFEDARQVELTHCFPRATLARLISEMPADERTDLFKLMGKEQRDNLLPVLAQAEREDIRKLSAYTEGTAGALMTSDYAMLKQDMTVKQALAALRREAPDAETIYHAYVTDEERTLIGVVSLRELILAHPAKYINELMTADPVSGQVNEDQEDIAKRIARYDLLALPITDDNGQLVGIVTYDDAMDVVSEEATDDMHKSAGVITSVGNLKDASIALLYRKRVFWLVMLVFGNLFSSAGISHFEDIISANLVLVLFLPLLVGSGGNAGSQSSTLMVRALATGEVVMKDWFVLLGREILLALALGLTMAAAVSLLGYLRGDIMVALVLAVSMVSIVLTGCVLGMSLPFVLNKIGVDPASSSAPLITTVCDVSGVVIYLFVASRVLGNIGIS